MAALTAVMTLAPSACGPSGQTAAPSPALGAAAATVTTTTSPAQSPAAVAIDKAIGRAQKHLYKDWGTLTWSENEPPPPAGRAEQMALAIRALLESGESPDRPEVARALGWLNLQGLNSTRAYAGRLRANLLLPAPAWEKQIRSDVTVLRNGMELLGAGRGFHTPLKNALPLVTPEASVDAALALALAAKASPPINVEWWQWEWEAIDAAWRGVLPELIRRAPTGDNAASAITPVARAVDVLLAVRRHLDGGGGEGKPAPSDAAIEQAVASLVEGYGWLYRDPGSFEAIERFARIMWARRNTRVAGRDWLRDTTSFVLATQRDDGSWGDGPTDTAYALLFLASARRSHRIDELVADVAHDPYLASAAGLTRNRPVLPEPPREPDPVIVPRLPMLPAAPRPGKHVTLAVVADGARAGGFDAVRAAMLKRDTGLAIDEVALGQWTLQRYDIAWTTGARLLGLSALQRMEVRRFLELGGRLVVDISDTPGSADAVEGQVTSMFDVRRVEFGAGATVTDKEIAAAAEGLRVGRVEGRPAVVVADDAAKGKAVLEALLAGRAK
jgi:hypothetical protein